MVTNAFLYAEIDSVPVEITPENIPELENATIFSAEEDLWSGSDGSDYQNQYLDVTQQLELPVIGWLDTKTLGCRIEIHDTNGINLTPPAPKLGKNVTFTVPGNTELIFVEMIVFLSFQPPLCPPRILRSTQRARLWLESRVSSSFTSTQIRNRINYIGERCHVYKLATQNDNDMGPKREAMCSFPMEI